MFENSILIILPVLKAHLDITAEEKTIIDSLTRIQLLIRVQLDKITGFNKAKTGRILKRLIEQEIIEKIGKGKDTKYQLNI